MINREDEVSWRKVRAFIVPEEEGVGAYRQRSWSQYPGAERSPYGFHRLVRASVVVK